MPGFISSQNDRLTKKLSEFKQVAHNLDRLKFTRFGTILNMTNNIAELANAIKDLVNESPESLEKLKEIAKVVIDIKDDKRPKDIETMLKVVHGIQVLTNVIMREFKSEDSKEIAQMQRNMKDLAQDLEHKNSANRVPNTNLMEAASCTERLAQIMMNVTERELQDKWYQQHRTTANSINDCKSTDYAGILDIEESEDSEENTKAADNAFEKLSNLFDPNDTRGNKYYKGALSAADRKFSCAIL